MAGGDSSISKVIENKVFVKSKEDKVLDCDNGSLRTQHGSWFSFSFLLF